jgi:tetratricopeptide (TPR) repeat protein
MWRSVAPRSRRAWLVVVILFATAIRAEASPETRVSPLPPPVTRAVYRSHWFELLSALQEDDVREASTALDAMIRSARAAGVRHLSAYSRTALQAARKAEKARAAHAAFAYDAAVRLDDASFDAAASRVGFLFRNGRSQDAVAQIPPAFGTLFASAESRLSFFSSLAVAIAIALALGGVAAILGLSLTYLRRLWHDLDETASRPFGHRASTPLALLLLGLPLFLTLGPAWLLLYWAVLVFPYSQRRERLVLAGALLTLGLLPLFVDVIARENLIRRSPLYLAAVDLEERREDSSVEEELASIAAVTPDQPDVWFLLAMYAERSGDYPRALAAYGRAIQADPNNYRAFVNRGNVRFVEGDYAQAIEDYEEATRRAPQSAEAFYNLAVARSEIYDFKGQERARARAIQISRRDVDAWSSRPTMSRVVPAAYGLSTARERVERSRRRSADPPKSGRSGWPPKELLLSPWCLAPFAALLFAVVLRAVRSRRGVANECSRCGRAFCRFCKRYGGPVLYCGRCVRLYSRKEVAEDVRETERRGAERRVGRRRGLIRLTSLVAPGIHRFFAHRPFAAVVTLCLFFFALTLSLGGPWLFDLRPLSSAREVLPGRIAAAVAAIALWIGANVVAWRQTREP